MGTGLIGKSLVRMIADQFTKLSRENLLEVNLVAVANSKMLFNELGLALDSGIDQMKQKGDPMNMKAFIERMHELNLSNSIFVDCTSSEEVTEIGRAHV